MLLDDSDSLMLLSSNDASRTEVGLGSLPVPFRPPPDLNPSKCPLGQMEEIGSSKETISCSMSHHQFVEDNESEEQKANSSRKVII
jgi:hypothetical protein